MTQDELDDIAAETLHIDVSQLRASDLIPVECSCGKSNCHGWRMTHRLDPREEETPPVLEYEVSGDEIVSVECPECGGDAYKVITRGEANSLPVDFALCPECANLGVLSDGVIVPITDELSTSLAENYGSAYCAVQSLRVLTKRALMIANAHLN